MQRLRQIEDETERHLERLAEAYAETRGDAAAWRRIAREVELRRGQRPDRAGTTAGTRSRPGSRWIRGRATSSRSAGGPTGASRSTQPGSSSASPRRLRRLCRRAHSRATSTTTSTTTASTMTPSRTGTTRASPRDAEAQKEFEEAQAEAIRRHALAQIRQYPDVALRHEGARGRASSTTSSSSSSSGCRS